MSTVEILTPQQSPAMGAYDGQTKVSQGYFTAAQTKGRVDGRVSRQWADRPDDQRFTSLSDLRAATQTRFEQSREQSVNPRRMVVASREDTQEVGIMTEHMETPVPLNHWSFGQLANRVGAPAGYLRKLSANLAADCLNHGLQTSKSEALLSYTGENGGVMRAITGAGYGRVPDYQVVTEIMKVAGNGTGDTNWKIPGEIDWSQRRDGAVLYNPFVDITKENTTLYASDRDVWMFLVDDTRPIEIGKLPNGDPDLLFRGFIVWNSEVGNTSLGLQAFLLRGVCQNRNLWGVEAESSVLRIRHTADALDKLSGELAPALQNYVNASTAGIVEKVNHAKLLEIGKTDEEVVDWLVDRTRLSKDWSTRIVRKVEQEEGHRARSVWDVVQGITAAARSMSHQDDRVAMERTAGKLMDRVK